METIFTDDFWKELYSKIGTWVIETVPALILIFLLLLISLSIYRFIINKASKGFMKKIGADTNQYEKEKRIRTLTNILKQAGSLILWIVFLMIMLKEIGMEIGPILASAGVLGLAIGFGAQELVRDFISGFFLLLEDRIRTGDVAIVNGTGGLVEGVELRTLTLRDFSGVVHVFQNGKINTLANMTKEWSAIVFDIGVAYKENTDRVIEVMKEVGKSMEDDEEFGPKIINPLEIFGVDQFGDNAVVIKARFKTKPIEQWNVGREFRGRLKKAFDEHHIEIPFPHRTIYWGEEINPLRMKIEEMNKQNKLEE